MFLMGLYVYVHIQSHFLFLLYTSASMLVFCYTLEFSLVFSFLLSSSICSPLWTLNIFNILIFFYCFLHLFLSLPILLLFLFYFIYFLISWRLITLQYCSGFCHTLTWISLGYTCIPHPDPPSLLPLHPILLGLPSAPGLSTCLMHPTWAGGLFHPR